MKDKRSCCIITVEVCPTRCTKKFYQNANETGFQSDAKLLPVPSVSIGFGTISALQKLKSTLDTTEINNFRENEKAMITNSPLRYPLT